MKIFIKTTGWLAMAAALTLGTAACSSDDDIVNEQPVNPTEPKTYTMTIHASKGDDNTTRGLYWNNPNTYDEIKVLWHEGEKVRVVQNGVMVGTLTSAASNDGSTTLSGTLTGIKQDDDLQFYLHADENCKMDYTGQNGGVVMQLENDGNIEYNYDFAEAKLTKYEFRLDTQTGTITNSDNSQLIFTSNQAIVRFELFNSDGSANVYAQKLIISDGNTGKIVQSIDGLTGTKTYGPVTHAPSASNQSCIFTVALNVGSDANIVLDAIGNDGNVYAYNRSKVTFEPGKYYKVKVKMNQRTQKFIKEITPEDTYLKGWYVTEYGTVTKGYDASSCYAVVAYVGKVDHYFDNFIALGLNDAKKDGTDGSEIMTWSDALTAAYKYDENHHVYQISSTQNTSAYDAVYVGDPLNPLSSKTRTGDAVRGWRLPSVTDWRYIFQGVGGISATNPEYVTTETEYYDVTVDLFSLINSYCRNNNLKDDSSYWTSSELASNTSSAWDFCFVSQLREFGTLGKDVYNYVRPVFAY